MNFGRPTWIEMEARRLPRSAPAHVRLDVDLWTQQWTVKGTSTIGTMSVWRLVLVDQNRTDASRASVRARAVARRAN